MLKNFVIWSGFYALTGIVLTSVITESLNKSTFADCKANISIENKACKQVLKTGSSCLLTPSVIGANLDPLPPARIIPFLNAEFDKFKIAKFV